MIAATDRKEIQILERKAEIYIMNRPVSKFQGAEEDKPDPEIRKFLEYKLKHSVQEIIALIVAK
jgi:hypothetical protein